MKIHLIDASPYIFRSYFSVPSSVVDREGNPANAVHGFTSFLLRYLDEQVPTHIGLAYDESLTTSYRNEIYPEYKAQRELPDDALEAQQRDCRLVAQAMGFSVFSHERYEADDLIATALNKTRGEGREFVVVTSDKDLMQLVDDSVELFDFAKDLRYDAARVKEKFGVRPDQIRDFLGLAGDPVDNIPGVRGVGPKTAVALLDEFDDLDSLYDRLDEVETLGVRGAKSLKKKLEDSRDLAFLSRELATVSIEAPIEPTADSLARQPYDMLLVDELFGRLGFEGLKRRLLERGS